MSPIPMADGEDSMTVHVGTPDSETVTPVVVDQIRSAHRHRSRKPSSPRTNGGNPASGAFKDILCEEALIKKRPGSVKSNNRDIYPVPRWRLAREGPFPFRRPLFVFWGKVALSDTLRMNGMTTPGRRVVSAFR